MTRLISPVGPHAISAALPTRAALHPARKAFHFLTGYIFALCNRNLPTVVWQPLASVLFLLAFATEITRIRSPAGKVNRFVMNAFRPFMRSHETHQFSGMAYYLFGVAVASLLFSTTSACLGIICLASLDPIAALMGSAFQPHIPQARLRNGKSVAGFIFSASTAVLVVTLVLTQATSTNMTTADMCMMGFFVGVAGAATELAIPSPQRLLGGPKFPLGIDDNAIIPIVSAAICELLLQITTQSADLAPLLLVDTGL